MTPSSAPKNKHLDLPTPTGISRDRDRLRLTPTPSNQLPATALFQGPQSRNESYTSLHRLREDRDRDRDRINTPIDNKPQHLPRANPPTASFSFSGPPRPTLIGEPKNPAAGRPGATTVTTSKKEDDFRADAVWAEMQRTLADVKLSAMNSSHVFSSEHAKALEDLRGAQLGLALAWGKGEGDEMGDEEFRKDAQDQGAIGQLKSGMFGGSSTTPTTGKDAGSSANKGHSRQGSTSSVSGRVGELEEETERDIRLARKRREANDRYFKQVNDGVLDVVRKLDEVVGAMRRVEKESREIWNESSENEDLGDATETDESVKRERQRDGANGTRTESPHGGTTGDDTDVLTDSAVESRR